MLSPRRIQSGPESDSIRRPSNLTLPSNNSAMTDVSSREGSPGISLGSLGVAKMFANKTRQRVRRKSITAYKEGVTSRETAARLFWPAQRQDWVEREDAQGKPTLVNSADGVKRAIQA